MQLAHVSQTSVGTHVWESVQTCELLLIGQRLESVQTDQPQAENARASGSRILT